MNFQKRLFRYIPFLICFCLVLGVLISPVRASFVSSMGSYCPTCRTGTLHIFARRVEATCTESGFDEYICEVCGVGITRYSISALGHDWTETSYKSATCTESGSIHYDCSRCTETKIETIPQLATDHTWVETSRTSATCTAAGSISYECSTCHSTKTDPLQALDHNWIETSRKPATCIEFGTVNYICSRCSETQTTILPALAEDHTWVETSRTEATAVPGSIEYTCSVCGDVKYETIPAVSTDSTAGIDDLMTGFEYVVLLFGEVWELMLSNMLLTLFLAASLVVVGVKVFRRLKSVARV